MWPSRPCEMCCGRTLPRPPPHSPWAGPGVGVYAARTSPQTLCASPSATPGHRVRGGQSPHPHSPGVRGGGGFPSSPHRCEDRWPCSVPQQGRGPARNAPAGGGGAACNRGVAKGSARRPHPRVGVTVCGRHAGSPRPPRGLAGSVAVPSTHGCPLPTHSNDGHDTLPPPPPTAVGLEPPHCSGRGSGSKQRGSCQGGSRKEALGPI